MEIIEFNSLPDHLMLPLTSNQEKLKTSNWNSALQSKGKKFIDKKGNTNYTFVLNGFETETNEKSNNYFDNLVIRHSKKEGVSYFIVRYHPEENWLFESKDFEHFNGRLSFYGLKGNPLGATNLENGKPIAKNQNTKSGDGCNLTIYGEEPFCVGTVDGKLACWIYFDYSISCGGGEGVDTYPYGDVEDPTNSDTGDTGGTGSSGGSNSGDEPGGLDEIDGGFVPELPEEEEKINTDELNNPCVEQILKKLLEKDDHYFVIPELGSEVKHLSQIILDLFDKSATLNLTFKIDDLGAVNAKTTPNVLKGEYTITLDDTYIQNGTDLAIARTIIHESVHAWLSYLNQGPPSDLKTELLTYLQKNGYDYEDAQHMLMSDYAPALASSIAAWDNHRLVDSSTMNGFNYYNALSFSGEMLNSTAFKQLSTSEQQMVLDANTKEGDAVNSSTSDAKGSKCP